MPLYDEFAPSGGEVMRVGIYAFDEITRFHLAVPQMVCDEVARQGLAPWEAFLFADGKRSVRPAVGYRIAGGRGVRAASEADGRVVASWFADGRAMPAPSQRMLIAAQQRGATLVGLCLGALPLVDAALLRGRSAVTHWHAFDLLRHRHSEIPLDDSVLYIDHG